MSWQQNQQPAGYPQQQYQHQQPSYPVPEHAAAGYQGYQQGAQYPMDGAYNQAQYPGQQQQQQQHHQNGFPAQQQHPQGSSGTGFAAQLAGAQKIYNMVNGKPTQGHGGGGGHGSKPNSKVNLAMKAVKMGSKFLEKNKAGKANPMAAGHAQPAGGYHQAPPAAAYSAPTAGGHSPLPGSY